MITSKSKTVDGGKLLDELREVMRRYAVLPPMAAETLALWIVHTYAFTLRQVTTYIGVVSPEKRCGKTTLLELLGALANRSLSAANISPSALFRVIEETQPTLLIDEADTFLTSRDELAGILNAGYRKGNSYVVRVSQGGNARHGKNGRNEKNVDETEWRPGSKKGLKSRGPEVTRHSCWCPKVMAGIGRLPETLADRCIVITMHRKRPGEKCERLRDLNAGELRRRCVEFAKERAEEIAKAQPEMPGNLNDRAADIWEPLLVIAELAGGPWPALAREAAQRLSAPEEDPTLLGYFVKDLRNLMVLKEADRMLSRELVALLDPMRDRPWEDLRRRRKINEWWLGWRLRELGIRSKTMRIGESVGRGYLLADVEEAFQRYVSQAEAPANAGMANDQGSMANEEPMTEKRAQAGAEQLPAEVLAVMEFMKAYERSGKQGEKAPSSKLQVPKKLQRPSSNE